MWAWVVPNVLMTAAMLAGAAAPAAPVAIRFVAEVNGRPFACSETYRGIGTSRATWQPQDLRLYVSDVARIDAAGAPVAVALDDDGTWQSRGVAMLDFEDRSGTCQNGTKETHTALLGTTHVAQPSALRGLRFRIAVPFAQNHADASAAMPPLDQAGMFWSWQGGYKFLSVDGRVNGKAGHSVHIGSTGCQMDGPNRVSGCAKPNIIEVDLPHFDIGHDVVVIDIGHLLSTSDLSGTAHPSANGCMGEPDNAACRPLFDVAGLTGRPQRFISARRTDARPPAQ